MNLEWQKSAPICEALEQLQRRRVVPFDVPGHKRGRGNPELVKLLGERCVGMDVNSMCYPPGIPIISPGERVTNEIIDYILFARAKGCTIQGASDPRADYLMVIKE